MGDMMEIDYDKLVNAIAMRVTVPIEDQVWSKEQVAEYLQVSPRQVIERYANRPDFPESFKIADKKLRRWYAAEVIAWAKSWR